MTLRGISNTLSAAQQAALVGNGATTAGGLTQRRTTPVAMVSPRMSSGGYNWWAFTDHTAYTGSGETTGYTLSTVSGYNGISYDGSGSKTGSSAMVKLAAAGQAGAANYILTSASNLNLSLIDNKLGFWVYYSPDSTWLTPSINIAASIDNNFAFDGINDIDFTATANQIRQGWNFIVLKATATSHPYGLIKNTGGPNFAVSQLKKFRFYMTVPNGKTATFYFDTAWSNFNTKPAFVIGLDGVGTDDVTTYWTPIMQSYGYKFYFAMSAQSTGDNSRVGSYYGAVASGQPNQITNAAAFYNAGGEIINHTLNHTNVSDASRAAALTDGQLNYQMKAQTAWQLSFGWDRGKEFYAAPQGNWDWTTLQKIKAMGFIMQRQGVAGSNNTLTPFGYAQPENMGWMSLDAPISGTACSDNWKSFVDTMIDYGADCIFGAHQIIADVGTVTGTSTTGDSQRIYYTSFLNLLNYLRTKEAAGECVVISLTEMAYGLR